MRITYIHQHYTVPKGPQGGRPHETAKRLAARGHDVHLVSATSDPHAPRTQRVGDVTVHWVKAPYSNHMGNRDRILAFLRFAVRASRIARSIRGDVVLASSTPLTTVIPGYAAVAGRRASLVFEVRDLWPDAPIAMGALGNPVLRTAAIGLERFAYAAASHVIALSPGMAEGVRRSARPGLPVTVIPNAADNDFFNVPQERGAQWRSRHHELGAGPLVLYAGTLGRVNDVGWLAEVAKHMASIDPDVSFVVVGDGNDAANVSDRATRLGVLGRNFHLLPPVDKNEMADIFSAADVSVSTVAPIPALNANSANKVFDTLAAGRPLVINHEGWLADMIRRAGCGLVLPQLDLERAAHELATFLRSPDQLTRARRASRHLAETDFDRDRLVDKVAQILETTATRLRPAERFTRRRRLRGRPRLPRNTGPL